jgi:hypothetical protein
MPSQPITSNRPGTLAQALQLARGPGESLRYCLAGFLDGFYADPDPTRRRASIEDAPDLLGDERWDAFVGGIGEHLCHRWNLGEPPAWTNDPARFLARPWFVGPERMKAFLLAESPSAFRRRFIFTEIEPLRRVSMPKDGRWWAYEIMRTGRVPDPDEIEQGVGVRS